MLASDLERSASSPLRTSSGNDANLYLLNSIQKSQEDWNYLAIFILSIVAIALDCLLPGK